MSAAVIESIQKGMQNDQRLRSLGIPLTRDSVSRYSHLDYLYTIPPKNSFPATALNAQSIIDFEIKNAPGFFLHDNRSLILYIKAAETGGTNSVTPTFAEAFFDKNNSVEWLCNGQSLGTPMPMMETFLEPLIEMSDTEYSQITNLLNHSSALAANSTQAISAGTSAVYFVRVPNPFPKDGIWLGALNDNIWTLRLRTQSNGAVAAGTGTLSLIDIQLLLECITVPDSEVPDMKREWSAKTWTASMAQLFESPSQITLVSSGESPRTQFMQFKDLSISSIYFFLHASRSFTASAYFTMTGLQNSSTAYVIDRNGSQLFTSNGEYYGYNRYYRSTRNLIDSKLFANLPLIMCNPAPDLQARIHNGHDQGAKFIFSGDEYLVIKDSGSTSAVYVDAVAFYDAQFVLQDGKIQKVSQ